jgi:hypothetical protein
METGLNEQGHVFLKLSYAPFFLAFRINTGGVGARVGPFGSDLSSLPNFAIDWKSYSVSGSFLVISEMCTSPKRMVSDVPGVVYPRLVVSRRACLGCSMDKGGVDTRQTQDVMGQVVYLKA